MKRLTLTMSIIYDLAILGTIIFVGYGVVMSGIQNYNKRVEMYEIPCEHNCDIDPNFDVWSSRGLSGDESFTLYTDDEWQQYNEINGRN